MQVSSDLVRIRAQDDQMLLDGKHGGLEALKLKQRVLQRLGTIRFGLLRKFIFDF